MGSLASLGALLQCGNHRGREFEAQEVHRGGLLLVTCGFWVAFL